MAVTGNLGKYITLTAVADAVTGPLFIKAIHWYGTGTTGDTVVLKDSDGDVIFNARAQGTDYDNWYYYDRAVDGVTVDTLASGSIDILVG